MMCGHLWEAFPSYWIAHPVFSPLLQKIDAPLTCETRADRILTRYLCAPKTCLCPLRLPSVKPHHVGWLHTTSPKFHTILFVRSRMAYNHFCCRSASRLGHLPTTTSAVQTLWNQMSTAWGCPLI